MVVLPATSNLIDSFALLFHFNGVTIKSIHRQMGDEVSLSKKTRFKAGDVVLLQGEKQDLLKAEQALQRKKL